MRSASSVQAQVGGLVLTALVSVLVISFSVVLLTPTPSAPRMTVNDAAAALRQPEEARRLGLTYRYVRALPGGRSTPLIASAIAKAAGLPAAEVRAWWSEDSLSTVSQTGSGQTVMVVAGQDVVVEGRNGGFTLRSGQGAVVSPHAWVPPFSTARRQKDGRWLMVGPSSPLFAAWRLRMLAAFLLSAGLLAPLAWLIARRLTRPIRDLAAGAEKVHLGSGDLSESGPSEVRAAARAINNMRQRLSGEATERTRMLAAVAHDLRNPLTGLRIRAEATPEPDRGRMINDLDRMAGMIAQVLDYAKGREAQEPRQRVCLADLLRACAEDAAEKGDKVSAVEPPSDIVAEVEVENLRRAIDNLVENAVRYGDEARLSLAGPDGLVSIIVDDDGPGLPEAEIARLVEPFQRLEASRNRDTGGSGLGLSIARDVAERHHGALVLRNRDGGGLRAEIRLPRLDH